MKYEEKRNGQYGMVDSVYKSLDGMMTTYYNAGAQATYYEKFYPDWQSSHMTYTVYDTLNHTLTVTESDSFYHFYSNYDAATGTYYTPWMPNTDRETLIAILGGTLPLGVIAILIAMCQCGCIKCKRTRQGTSEEVTSDVRVVQSHQALAILAEMIKQEEEASDDNQPNYSTPD